MAFVRLDSTPRYTCLSTDVKPVALVALGSTAYETDTGDLYIFNGAAWVIKSENNFTLSGSEFESVTVDDTAGGLTAATYGDATSAFITVEDHPMRYRVDGDDATDAIGHLVDDGDSIILSSAADIANFSAIRTTADSATIRVTYYE